MDNKRFLDNGCGGLSAPDLTFSGGMPQTVGTRPPAG